MTTHQTLIHHMDVNIGAPRPITYPISEVLENATNKDLEVKNISISVKDNEIIVANDGKPFENINDMFRKVTKRDIKNHSPEDCSLYNEGLKKNLDMSNRALVLCRRGNNIFGIDINTEKRLKQNRWDFEPFTKKIDFDINDPNLSEENKSLIRIFRKSRKVIVDVIENPRRVKIPMRTLFFFQFNNKYVRNESEDLIRKNIEYKFPEENSRNIYFNEILVKPQNIIQEIQWKKESDIKVYVDPSNSTNYDDKFMLSWFGDPIPAVQSKSNIRFKKGRPTLRHNRPKQIDHLINRKVDNIPINKLNQLKKLPMTIKVSSVLPKTDSTKSIVEEYLRHTGGNKVGVILKGKSLAYNFNVDLKQCGPKDLKNLSEMLTIVEIILEEDIKPEEYEDIKEFLKQTVTNAEKTEPSKQDQFILPIERIRIMHHEELDEIVPEANSCNESNDISRITPVTNNYTEFSEKKSKKKLKLKKKKKTEISANSPLQLINSDEESQEESKSNINTRTSSDNFNDTVKNKAHQEVTLWEDERKFHLGRENSGKCACLMCDRVINRSKLVAGHIVSYVNGGKPVLENCVYICIGCNNNDTRNIAEVMLNDYGKNHPNTINFIKFCIKNNKNLGKYEYLKEQICNY